MSRDKAREVLEDGIEMAEEHGTGHILIGPDEAADILEGLDELGVSDGDIVAILDDQDELERLRYAASD